MHKTLITGGALLLAALGGDLRAQRPDQEELKARKAAKLGEPWLQNADWILDYEEAKAKSAETGKPIFAYFTRSFAF